MKKRISISGESVLKLLVDGSGLTFRELCRAIGFEPDWHTFHPMELLIRLRELNDASLITIDGVDQDIKLIHTALNEESNRAIYPDQLGKERRIRASDAWRKIQYALRVGYLCGYDLTGRRGAYSLIAYPLFGMPVDLPKRSDIFVLMPFAEGLAPVYRDHIALVASELELSVMRADDLFTNNSVITDVWSGIIGCGVVVADCTGRNPNVFYEIGIAHTLGKPTILITQHSDDVPVDLRHIKHILYEPENCNNFKIS